VIIKDLGDSLFSILIDESRDISIKEQMTIIEGLENREISSGQGLNQEISLRRYGDTR
jgi:hypothetical protein